MKRIIKQHLRHKAIVTLKSGAAFAGVLFSADSEALLLRNAESLDVGTTGERIGIDGELLILRADVAFIQLP